MNAVLVPEPESPSSGGQGHYYELLWHAVFAREGSAARGLTPLLLQALAHAARLRASGVVP